MNLWENLVKVANSKNLGDTGCCNLEASLRLNGLDFNLRLFDMRACTEPFLSLKNQPGTTVWVQGR